MSRLKAGSKVERYIVEGALGEGGMARVYRVRHETLGTQKALKVLTLTARDVRKRLVQEGQVQATLSHDNIVKVEDVLQVKDAPALLMEFVDGPTLEAWLTRYQPTLDESLALFRGICAGVGHAHAKGLIHRDLKPANVLLSIGEERMIPKVTDFGLAKAVRREDFVDAGGKTRTGATMGTPQFMAPEQIRDASQVDRRADVWSLGCILYRLACGVSPFEGDDIIELFNVIASGDYIPPKSLKRDLPDRIADAIDAMLEADPTRRLQDCGELLEFLDGEIDALGERTLVPLGSLREATPPTTTGPRWLPASSEAAKIARELADETLDHLPKLKRNKDKTWTTPDPAPPSQQATVEPTSRRTSSRAQKKPRSKKVTSETLAPTGQDTDVPQAPPPPARGTARRVALGVVALSLLGGVGLLLVGAGVTAWSLGWIPEVQPPPIVHTDPVPVPTPPPRPVRPVPAHTDPMPARPTPGPVHSPPAPVPIDGGETAPAPVPPPTGTGTGLAEVTYTGAKLLWLEPEGGGGAEREREVPPGRYRVMAVFEGRPEAVMAGRVTLREGQKVTINCVPAFQQCKP